MHVRLLLAWNVNYYEPGGAHWWNVRVDAITGKELERNDWVSACGFDEAVVEVACETPEAPMAPPAAPNDYRVYPWPLESPSFGARSVKDLSQMSLSRMKVRPTWLFFRLTVLDTMNCR